MVWLSCIHNALETTWIIKVIVNKSYTESIQLFGTNFRWLFLKFEFSNYQTLIKAYVNIHKKKLLVFLKKKISRETKKKIQLLCIQDYVMHTKKSNFAYKNFDLENVFFFQFAPTFMPKK